MIELNLKSSKSKRIRQTLFTVNLLLLISLFTLLYFTAFQRYKKIYSQPDFVEGAYISDDIDLGVYNIYSPNSTERLDNISSSDSLVAFNPHTYEIYYSDNVNERRAIASLTKLMTALVVADHWEMDEQIEVVQKPKTTEYNLGLKTGDKFTVEDGLKVILIKSYNDAAQVFADSYEGEEKAFVKKMNAKADELGMNSTHFSNSSGLSDKDNYSTARDLQKLTKHFMQNEELMSIVSQKYAVVSIIDSTGAERNVSLYTTNKLLADSYPGVKGMKTGYTGKAGECFITYYDKSADTRQDDLILIILDSDNRFADAEKVIESIK